MTNSSRNLLVSVCILALATAACSSPSTPSAGKGSKTTSTTTTASSSSSTTAVPSAQDQVIANKVVLRTSDLLGLWTVGPVDPNSTAGDAQVSRCLGIPDSDPDETAYTGSPVFTQTSGASSIQITSQTSVYNSVTAVQGDLRGRLSPHAATCVAQLLEAELPGVSHVQLSLTPLPATAGTLQGFRLKGSFQVVQSGKLVSSSVDEVALAKDRVEVAIDIVTMNSPQPAGLMDRATAAIAPRLEAAP